MHKHTILYVAPEITLPGTHGGSTHVSEVVDSLINLGHTVVLHSKWQKGLPFYERRKNLYMYRTYVPNNGIIKNILYFLYALFLTPLFFLMHSVTLVYERSRIFAGIPTLYAQLFRKKSVFELNEPLETFATGNQLLHSFVLTFAYFVTSRATLVTGTHHSFFTHLHRDNTLLIDYGANPKRFHPNISPILRKKYGLRDKFVLLYSGSFAPWHALTQLIYAAHQLAQKRKDFVILLIGTGKQQPHLQQLVDDLQLERFVRFTGSVPYSAIPQHIAIATVALALFNQEHFKQYDYYYSPIKLHEYKACGKPILASNIGNLKKYVKNGVNGYTVDESDPVILAQTITKLFKNKTLLKKMASKNRQEVLDKYNWDSINKKILKRVEQ